MVVAESERTLNPVRIIHQAYVEPPVVYTTPEDRPRLSNCDNAALVLHHRAKPRAGSVFVFHEHLFVYRAKQRLGTQNDKQRSGQRNQRGANERGPAQRRLETQSRSKCEATQS